MPKKIYIGVDNVARQVKKIYVGIDGVARKVKKAYIGIGGVARPCWGGGELTYYGMITSLSNSRNQLAATSVGNYALFIGGYGTTELMTTADAYDTSLTRTTPTNLAFGRYRFAATSIGDYALFGGGLYYDDYDETHVAAPDVLVCDTSLTKMLLVEF